jgi:hypothetical protein
MNDKIQRRLVPRGLTILKESPVSLFWLRMLWAIVADLPNFAELIPLVPRLYDAIESTDMIRILIELAADVYSYNLSRVPLEFVIAFIEFTGEFSARIRAVIHESGSEELETLLFCFWASFFQINDEIVQSEPCIQPMNAALSEFLVCTSECRIDEDVMRSLLGDAWNCLAYFFPPHPLQSVVPVFFQLCVTLLNNGTDEDALGDTVRQLANQAPGPFLEFVTAYMAERAVPDRGIIVVVAENLEALMKKQETRPMAEAFADRLAQIILATPIDAACVFTFVRNFAALDICQNYVCAFVDWLHRMFPSTPDKASVAFWMLAEKRGQIILAHHADAIPAFAAFLPEIVFPEQSSHLIAALLCLIREARSRELIGSICPTIGAHLMQAAALVVQQQNLKEWGRFLSLFDLLFHVNVDAGSDLHQFTDMLVNSVLRAFGDGLLLNDDSATFQQMLCHFIDAAIQAGWIRDLTFITEWCERMIASTFATIHHFMVIPYLPVEQMPATAAFLRQLQVSDDCTFNRALLSLLTQFAERGDFTSFFQPQIIFQLIDFPWPTTHEPLSLEIVRVILERNLIPSPEFYISCFEFLLMFGIGRSLQLQPRLARLLALIASRFDDGTPLKAVVAAHCDLRTPEAQAFVRAVIDRDRPENLQNALEQLYKTCVMH